MHQLSYRSLRVVSNIGVTGADWILPQPPERHPPFLCQDATTAIKTRYSATSNILQLYPPRAPSPPFCFFPRHPYQTGPPPVFPSVSRSIFIHRPLYKSTSCRCSRFDTSPANFPWLEQGVSTRIDAIEFSYDGFPTVFSPS